MIATFLLIGGLSLKCNPEPKWIRSLPVKPIDTIKNSDTLLEGIYIRPSKDKSPMGSKDYHYSYKEWIEFKKDKTFAKNLVIIETLTLVKKIKVLKGIGVYSQEGPWVLLETLKLSEKECSMPIANLSEIKFDIINPCSMVEDNFKEFSHALLYYFDPKQKSIAHMLYESGYKEANFGIAWELIEPYLEDERFKLIKAKYTKKEFQPHVYNYGRLD